MHRARLVILHADRRAPDEFDNRKLYDDWVTSLFAVTDLLNAGLEIEDHDARLAWEIRQGELNHHADQLPATAIHFELYSVLWPELLPEGADAVEEAFRSMTGISIGDYSMVGSAVMARLVNFAQAGEGAPMLQPDVYFASTRILDYSHFTPGSYSSSATATPTGAGPQTLCGWVAASSSSPADATARLVFQAAADPNKPATPTGGGSTTFNPYGSTSSAPAGALAATLLLAPDAAHGEQLNPTFRWSLDQAEGARYDRLRIQRIEKDRSTTKLADITERTATSFVDEDDQVDAKGIELDLAVEVHRLQQEAFRAAADAERRQQEGERDKKGHGLRRHQFTVGADGQLQRLPAARARSLVDERLKPGALLRAAAHRVRVDLQRGRAGRWPSPGSARRGPRRRGPRRSSAAPALLRARTPRRLRRSPRRRRIPHRRIRARRRLRHGAVRRRAGCFRFLLRWLPIQLSASVRSDGDYGLTVHVRNISQGLPFDGTELTSGACRPTRRTTTSAASPPAARRHRSAGASGQGRR
jgi:hypothetical protein